MIRDSHIVLKELLGIVQRRRYSPLGVGVDDSRKVHSERKPASNSKFTFQIVCAEMGVRL